jgi:hypothetical protein
MEVDAPRTITSNGAKKVGGETLRMLENEDALTRHGAAM